jgi:hypothetical protein
VKRDGARIPFCCPQGIPDWRKFGMLKCLELIVNCVVREIVLKDEGKKNMEEDELEEELEEEEEEE